MFGDVFVVKKVNPWHRQRIISLLIFLLLSFVGQLSNGIAGSREHGAHVHGIGKLNIALDHKDLMLELTSPAANIVGFEHAPENEEQTHAVEEAAEVLQDGDKLFTMTSKAQCSLHEAYVDSDMIHGHEDEHASQEQEPRSTHADHEHAEKAAHSDFRATYHFECSKPEHLRTLEVLLFKYFPGLEELEVQLLTAKVQTAVELTPKNMQISF